MVVLYRTNIGVVHVPRTILKPRAWSVWQLLAACSESWNAYTPMLQRDGRWVQAQRRPLRVPRPCGRA